MRGDGRQRVWRKLCLHSSGFKAPGMGTQGRAARVVRRQTCSSPHELARGNECRQPVLVLSPRSGPKGYLHAGNRLAEERVEGAGARCLVGWLPDGDVERRLRSSYRSFIPAACSAWGVGELYDSGQRENGGTDLARMK